MSATRRLRIALFVDAFPVMTETFILNQITGLIERGHDIDVFARARRRYDSDHPDIARYDLITRTVYLGSAKRGLAPIAAALRTLASTPAIRSAKGAALLARILKSRDSGIGINVLSLVEMAARCRARGGYDIVHAQFGELGRWLLPAFSLGALEGRLVTSFRGHDITQASKLAPDFYSSLYAHGALFLPVSHDLEQRLVRNGCPPNCIRVLHSGIDVQRFAFHARHRAPGEPTRIISVARFVEMKGLEYGIRAVAALVREGHALTYDIIGDGVLREPLVALIASLGVAEHIHLLGWQTHDAVAELLGRAHILLAPSVTAANGETEGIPNSVKEAMAMGLPVVSTYHSGVPELVEDGVSGLLAPERDAVALAQRLAELIAHPERWAALGREGRRKVEAEFSRDPLNDELVRLYESVLDAGAAEEVTGRG
jgi:colanic acid/amylovoran biosynthesis glycosyltransferase